MVMSVIINNDLIVYLINGLTLENIPCNMQLVPCFLFFFSNQLSKIQICSIFTAQYKKNGALKDKLE